MVMTLALTESAAKLSGGDGYALTVKVVGELEAALDRVVEESLTAPLPLEMSALSAAQLSVHARKLRGFLEVLPIPL